MKNLDDLVSQVNTPPLIPTFKQIERRLLSVFMALLELSPEVRSKFLFKCGYGSGKTCNYKSLMEISYKGSKYPEVRPDGLIVCTRGQATWSAFIEAKAEKSLIRSEQIQDYVKLAGLVDVPAIITISNEFARQPDELPYHLAENKRKGVTVVHFAWADIRTFLELVRYSSDITDLESALIQQCLNYFWAESSGVQTYDLMPVMWPDFVESASTALGFNQNMKGLAEIVHGWQQERRDLCSKLTHFTNRPVELRHKAGVRASEDDRLKADKADLANEYVLGARYFFPDTKAYMDLHIDLRACRTSVAFEVSPPENKGAKATVSWLARMLSDYSDADLSLVFDWPGKNNDVQIDLKPFLEEPTVVSDGKKDAPRRILLLLSQHGVRRFKSRKLFIEDVELTALEMTKLGVACGWVQQ